MVLLMPQREQQGAAGAAAEATNPRGHETAAAQRLGRLPRWQEATLPAKMAALCAVSEGHSSRDETLVAISVPRHQPLPRPAGSRQIIS